MLELALASVESRLLAEPRSTDLRFQQACLLEHTGRLAEARALYQALLEIDPSHVATLNNLGNLLLASGERDHARPIFQQAVASHPTHLPSRANLGNLLIKQGDLAEACEHFRAALLIDPTYRPAHAGLSFALGDLGDPTAAANHRQLAFADRAIVVAAYRGVQPPITILELVSTTGGNVRTDPYLSDRVFQRILVTTEFFKPGTPLPQHDLVFNAIGEADSATAALAGAIAVIAQTAAPVINPPQAVLATGRSEISQRLAAIPGVITARTVTLPRTQLESPEAASILSAQGIAFPILLRTPGFHGGDHFVRAESPSDLPQVLTQLPGDDLLVMPYLDARGPDGNSRKYRAMFIDGRIYPLHLAVSKNWKIHYFSADMADSPENRAEDRAFLEDMPTVLGPIAMSALEQIHTTLALDYAGIDFGLNSQGELLLFEANATMTVVIPDKDPRWDYRRPAVETIYKAVWQMLKDRAAQSPA
jgi:tetratricopeptide (TPR) repeat protein